MNESIYECMNEWMNGRAVIKERTRILYEESVNDVEDGAREVVGRRSCERLHQHLEGVRVAQTHSYSHWYHFIHALQAQSLEWFWLEAFFTIIAYQLWLIFGLT